MRINVSNVKNWDTWHAIALVQGVLIAMIMATLQQIAQTKSHHQGYQPDTETTILTQDDMIDPTLGITIKIGTITVTNKTGIDLSGQDPIHTVIDTGVTVTVIHEEVALGPITNPHATAHNVTEAQAHTTTNETPHTADPHHAEVVPEIAVDPDHTIPQTPPQNISKTILQL